MHPMNILLPQVFPALKPEQHKLHLACWNGENQPLDVFIRDRVEWDAWNTWRSTRDDFSREFIFSLIEFYPQKDMWLFGGSYRVLSRRNVNNACSYDIEPLAEGSPFIGRLK